MKCPRMGLRTIRLTLATCLWLAGCSGAGPSDSAGQLSIRSRSDLRTALKSGFGAGIYSYDDRNNVTVVLFDGPQENPAQAVTIRLFWKPRAGRTPIDATATNATIHYIIFTGTETKLAGVYSGAGFVYPKNTPGDATFTASVWDANLLLGDSTWGFQDLLGQAQLKGGFTAQRNDAKVQESIRRLNILVRERLGYPRFVQAGEEK